ncbi:TlpA family protein disulfide reductase [Mucilaginibacter sp. HMF5004]|uniref:peroxiredoxin family protein n=1 Tax=Mucilaginibacter rivuli TaxID=2857527 RepID=UPI001C600DFE|nr:TlpA disulfide reductase family protein [Mucilaginibacter rivuli]MBW4888646.1 TlpA family protein disulfide reductase [Mucilaginibacter rivuli]
MNRFNIFFSIIFLFFASSSFTQSKLHTGIWHAGIKTQSGKEIPFTFEVTNKYIALSNHDTIVKKQLVIINGSERFKVNDVKAYGDSVLIHMPLFDADIKGKFDGNTLKGQWIKHLPNREATADFYAVAGNYRFFKAPKSTHNVQGRWSAIFASGDTTVAEFKQVGTKVTGTFLTTTGDYRFLEGVVNKDSLYLSTFDGTHAYLFTAKINPNNTLTDGKQYAGYAGTDKWTAVKNAKAKLPDAYSLTYLKPGAKKIDFTFTDLDGKKVSLSDDRFKNKVVILQIMGSWCPNCMDETAYMVDFYKKYHAKGVEVVGLAYERSIDFNRSKKSVEQLKDRFNVTYPLLITGYTSDKKELIKSLPVLANFMGFPTTIIIDKKGDVRKIHTGFSGPGTGKYYTDFTTEFEKLNNELLAEK